MIINPLAEHIDLRDHYLAFIDLEKFGLEKEMQDERCTHTNLSFKEFIDSDVPFRLSVRQLKDTIQLSLLQQSEYLRRFSLVFCQKVKFCFVKAEIRGIRKIVFRFKRRTV